MPLVSCICLIQKNCPVSFWAGVTQKQKVFAFRHFQQLAALGLQVFKENQL